MSIYVIETPHQGAPICWVADDEEMFIGLADSGTKREPLREDATFNEACIYLGEGLADLAMFHSTDNAARSFLSGWHGMSIAGSLALLQQLRYRIGEISDPETRLRVQGIAWKDARSNERQIANEACAVIRSAADTMPETKIAEALGCDRMTVRRALGKL
jgi:hypothetical protein